MPELTCDYLVVHSSKEKTALFMLYCPVYVYYQQGGDNRAVTELSFGHVTTKTWAYSGVFGFFRKTFWQKNCPPPPKSLFENTMGNPFFGTPFFGTKRSKKIIQNSNYIALFQKTAFGFDPGPREVPEPENTQIRILAHFCIFWFGHFPSLRPYPKAVF